MVRLDIIPRGVSVCIRPPKEICVKVNIVKRGTEVVEMRRDAWQIAHSERRRLTRGPGHFWPMGVPSRTDFKQETGRALQGDEECGNQMRHGLPGRPRHQGNHAGKPVWLKFRLNLSRKAMRIVSVGTKRRSLERPNGKPRLEALVEKRGCRDHRNKNLPVELERLFSSHRTGRSTMHGAPA